MIMSIARSWLIKNPCASDSLSQTCTSYRGDGLHRARVSSSYHHFTLVESSTRTSSSESRRPSLTSSHIEITAYAPSSHAPLALLDHFTRVESATFSGHASESHRPHDPMTPHTHTHTPQFQDHGLNKAPRLLTPLHLCEACHICRT